MNQWIPRLSAPDQVISHLLQNGFALTGPLIAKAEAHELTDLFEQDPVFRSTIRMERYNFGHGTYRYFRYELPPLVQSLRSEFYQYLLPAAREWAQRLKSDVYFPDTHSEFRTWMAQHGHTRPTPLILRYDPGDYNCVHADISGSIYFPFQMIFALSEPNVDYTGGELLLLQQRPRMQTIPRVFHLQKGEAIILCSNAHPQLGKRGYYRSIFKHGVAEVKSGQRHTLGIIFHDYPERSASDSTGELSAQEAEEVVSTET